jgi:hypothetical protein
MFRSILTKTLVVAGWAMACALAGSPALAQHAGVGGRVGGGVRMAAPPHAPIARPQFVPGPHFVGMGRGGFRFRPGAFGVFRRGVFFGPRGFRFGAGWRFNRVWWPGCGPALGWAWGWGFECYSAPFYSYGFENLVTAPSYESPVYLYGGARDLVWLYRKDGGVYGVTDYWFVNGEVHYSMFEEGALKAVEHAFPYDELDVQKTINMNTQRGFRVVFRDEPWQQYLKDHPDVTPPDAPPAQKN